MLGFLRACQTFRKGSFEALVAAGDSPHRLRALLRQPAAVPRAAPQHARRHLQPPALLARGGGRHPAPRRWQVLGFVKCIYLKWLKRGFLTFIITLFRQQ